MLKIERNKIKKKNDDNRSRIFTSKCFLNKLYKENVVSIYNVYIFLLLLVLNDYEFFFYFEIEIIDYIMNIMNNTYSW